MKNMLVLGLALFVGFGCAGSSDEPAAFVYDEAALEQLTLALCTCGSSSGDAEECAEQLNPLAFAHELPRVEAGRVSVDAERWDACIERLSDCALPTPLGCEGLFIGHVEEGEACFSNSECVEGTWCGFPTEAPSAQCESLGVCTRKIEADRGEDCGGSDVVCKGDDYCPQYQEAELTVCMARLDEGEPCPIDVFGHEGAALCKEGLACIPDEDLNPVCGRLLGEGDPCDITLPEGTINITVLHARQPDPCGFNTYCDVDTLVCTPNTERPRGESRLQLGDRCVEGFENDECDYGLVCVDEQCVARAPNGASCENDDQCWSLCVADRCVPDFVACEL